jgi:hypothetical protein
MRLWSAEQAREYLWKNYEDNFTADEQPLRIVQLGTDDGSWFRFQVRFPGRIRIVTVGPRGAIYKETELSTEEASELR